LESFSPQRHSGTEGDWEQCAATGIAPLRFVLDGRIPFDTLRAGCRRFNDDVGRIE
jgi:hypothetical protein